MARKPFDDPAVRAVFDAYPPPVRARLLALRQMILDAARAKGGIGRIVETLKWGQPAYLTAEPKTGTTIRIDQVADTPGQYAIHFHCQTNLITTIQALYCDILAFDGNRSILLNVNDKVPDEILRHCIVLALTYHSRKRNGG